LAALKEMALGIFWKQNKLARRKTMEWEKPEVVEISLVCEISGYANAELVDRPPEQQRDLRFESER
jgi:hypothetical protein